MISDDFRLWTFGAAAAFLASLPSSCFPAAAPLFSVAASNVVATVRSDGSTNLWTEADLADALGLMNRRYWRDMETEAGRRSWHGAIASSAVRTNAANAVEIVYTYADGYVHSAPAPKRVTGAADAAAAAALRAERRAARLADWRARLDAATAVISAGLPSDAAGQEAFASAVIEAAKLRRAIERAESEVR